MSDGMDDVEMFLIGWMNNHSLKSFTVPQLLRLCKDCGKPISENKLTNILKKYCVRSEYRTGRNYAFQWVLKGIIQIPPKKVQSPSTKKRPERSEGRFWSHVHATSEKYE